MEGVELRTGWGLRGTESRANVWPRCSVEHGAVTRESTTERLRATRRRVLGLRTLPRDLPDASARSSFINSNRPSGLA